MRVQVVISLVVVAFLAVPGAAAEPGPSGMALQQIQAKDFEAPIGIVFPAVMTVLQDAGFRILTADKETGLITAQGSSEAKLSYNIWWGLGRKKDTPIVSAFIEERGQNVTRARLSFVISTGKDRHTLTDERPVTDPQVYQDAFEKIEKEIFVRQTMDAPTPKLPVGTQIIASLPAPTTPPLIAPPSAVAAESANPMAASQWRQASFSPGASIAFVDTANISREGGMVRFSALLYYRLDQGTDHFRALREADCSKRSFRDVTVTYYLGKNVKQAANQSGAINQAVAGTVNDRIIDAACRPERLGDAATDPDAVAQGFFNTASPSGTAPTVASVPAASPLWRQASYAPGASVAFVDATSVRRIGQTVQFGTRLYYRPDQGTDHYIALREADCGDQSFHDVSVTYYLGQNTVTTSSKSGPLNHPTAGTVNYEVVQAACDARHMGKAFADPDTAARLFFNSSP